MIPGGAAGASGVDLVLLPAPPITGRVVDPDGAGLGGAIVRLGEASATTADDGAFTLPPLAPDRYPSPTRIAADLEAELAGHVLVGVDVPGLAQGGAWESCALTMAEVAEVRVRAEDAHGAPLPGVDVALELAGDEPLRGPAGRFGGFELPGWSAETDERGRAVLRGVPAGIFLRVRAIGRVHESMTTAGVLGARPPDTGAAPIVAPGGGVLAHCLLAPPEAAIEGIVREPDGALAAEAFVRVLGAPGGELRRQARTDAEGSFALRVPLQPGDVSLTVVAESARGSRASQSPFGGRVRADPLCLASESVPLDGRAGPHVVDLLLVTTGAIEGLVLDARGARVSCSTVRLLPEGASPAPTLPGGEPAYTVAQGRGFRFGGVPPGRYVVLARSREHGVARSPVLDHRAAGVVARFGAPEIARVRVLVEGLGEGATATIAHGMIDLVDVRAGRPPALERMARFEGGGGFPAGTGNLSSGAVSLSGEGRAGLLTIDALDVGAETTLAMAPGPAVFGLCARDAKGRRYAEIGTGLVRLEAGEYVLTFASALASSLAVELPGGPAGERVEVRSLGGALLAESRAPRRSSLRFEGLPAGRVEVRAGTPEADGLAVRATATVELPPGDDVRAVLQGLRGPGSPGSGSPPLLRTVFGGRRGASRRIRT